MTLRTFGRRIISGDRPGHPVAAALVIVLLVALAEMCIRDRVSNAVVSRAGTRAGVADVACDRTREGRAVSVRPGTSPPSDRAAISVSWPAKAGHPRLCLSLIHI